MLKQQIQSDATKALKGGDGELAGVLRLVLSSINSKEKEKRYKVTKEEPNLSEEDLNKKSALSDDEVISVLFSEIKKRKDAIALYEKGNRPELAEKEKKEIEIIKKYLPEQLSQDELKRIIKEIIDAFYAKEIHPVKSAGSGVSQDAKQFDRVKDMGKIMADLMPKIKGKADTSEISKVAKELLAK